MRPILSLSIAIDLNACPTFPITCLKSHLSSLTSIHWHVSSFATTRKPFARNSSGSIIWNHQDAAHLSSDSRDDRYRLGLDWRKSGWKLGTPFYSCNIRTKNVLEHVLVKCLSCVTMLPRNLASNQCWKIHCGMCWFENRFNSHPFLPFASLCKDNVPLIFAATRTFLFPKRRPTSSWKMLIFSFAIYTRLV